MRTSGIIIIVLVLLSIRCGNDLNLKQSENKDVDSSLYSPVRVRLADCFTKPVRQIKLSDIAENVKYIALETTKDYLLGNIRSVNLIDEGILISDNTESLYMFGLSGKLVWKVNSVGRGPYEYEYLPGDFGIDTVLSELLIPDRRRLLVYGFNGKFKRLKDLSYFPGKAYFVPPGYYVFSNSNPYDSILAHVVDKSGAEIKQFINFNRGRRFDESGRSLDLSKAQCELYDKGVLISNKDTIWYFDENLTPEIRFIIDAHCLNEKDKYYTYSSNVINEYLICFTFFLLKKSYLYNSADSTFYCLVEDGKACLVDDIDFGPEVILGSGTNETNLSIIYPERLLPVQNRIRRESDLYKITAECREEDNPIIRILSLKKLNSSVN